MERILTIDALQNIGKECRFCGWVKNRRDHGKIIFIDLRDRWGVIQVVFTPQIPQVYELAQQLRGEWVVEVIGLVKGRPQGMENEKSETGKIEVEAKELKIYASANTLPFSIETSGYEISEEKRLKYRYLDLRRKRLQRNLAIRQKFLHLAREFLISKGFIEIETPLLTKSTPEGARDFIVPSRLEPGKFYALPQSPQQFKQLLMVAGIERYFQIARCLRDEDARGDRQAEHTQLDLEMSFVDQEEILKMIEELYIKAVKTLFPQKRIRQIPFPRLKYSEAMEKYHSDKPDLRENKADSSELAFCFITDFPMFEWSPERQKWGAMHHPFTKPQTEDIQEIKKYPEKILAFQHDFVLNGFEIGGGSIRTTNLEVLTAVFEVLGHSPKETREKFRNYFDSFSFGVPPHGGIACGVDRFLSLLLDEPNIREVIAFPKTGDNRDLMMGAPAEVEKEQLEELHLKIAVASGIKSKKKKAKVKKRGRNKKNKK